MWKLKPVRLSKQGYAYKLCRSFKTSSHNKFSIKNNLHLHKMSYNATSPNFPSRHFTSATPETNTKRGKERERTVLKVGDIVHGFKVLEVSEIPERNIIAILFTHTQTGASHLHLDTPDTNNVFRFVS